MIAKSNGFNDLSKKLGENELNQYISSNTSFLSWQDMKSSAAKEWVTKRL